MSDFAIKAKEDKGSQHVTVSEKYTPLIYHTTVQLQSGISVHIPNSQVPPTNTMRNKNYFRYTSSGDLSTVLQNGSSIYVQITRGTGSGPCSGPTYLRLILQNNTGAALQTVDAYTMIDRVEYQSPQGQQIQIISGRELRSLFCRLYDREHFRRLCKSANMNEYYSVKAPPMAAGEIRILYFPLEANPWSTGGLFLPAVSGDQNVYIYFKSPQYTLLSGSGLPTLTQCQIDVTMDYIPESYYNAIMNDHKKIAHQYFYCFPRRQTFSLNLAPSTMYQIYLNGIRGDVSLLDIFLHPQPNTPYDYTNFLPIDNFQIYNQEGLEISSLYPNEDARDRLVINPELFPSDYTLYRNYYSWQFPSEDGSAINYFTHARALGAYIFTTHEYIQFTTPAAGQYEIQVIAANSAPTSGVFSLTWTNEYGFSSTTTPLSYNATNATIQAAVQSLWNFDGQVTVTGSLNPGLSFTFGGNYQCRSLYNIGAVLSCNSLNLQIGGTPVLCFNVLSQTGINGFPTGVTACVFGVTAWTTGIYQLNTNGDIDARQS